MRLGWTAYGPRRFVFLARYSPYLIACFLLALSLNTVAKAQCRAGRAGTMDEVRRPVAMQDVIRMTRFADDGAIRSIEHYSPDGRNLIVVLRKGNLETNTNEYCVLLWKTDQLMQSSAPETLLTMSSSSNRDAIADITWLDDSETFAFLGETPGELRQLYTYNLRTRALKRLTNHPTNILSYSITPKGDKIAYIGEEPLTSIFDEKTSREGLIVSTQPVADLVAGLRGGRAYGIPLLFFQSGDVEERPIRVSAPIAGTFSRPFLSPNGRYIVIPTYVETVPESWKEYSNPFIRQCAEQKLAPTQHSSLFRYVWIDTTTGENRILLDVPGLSIFWQIAWSPDSHSVVVGGTYLPLNGTDSEERKVRQSKSFAVEVSVPRREVTKVSAEDLTLMRWDNNLNRLVFNEGNDLWALNHAKKEVVFRKEGDEWEKISNAVTGVHLPEITLDEGMNSPPRLVAIDHARNQRVVLLDPNPQFAALRFARVEEISWKDVRGDEIKGGLYYPLEYVPGKRYPLVIQTHDWTPRKFLIDGPFTTAFAAQPLAGQNIMVLQVGMSVRYLGTPNDVDDNAAIFDSAVEYLDLKGLIDRTRVGISGFSYTCEYVEYALTHSKVHFAAASITDGIDGGYFQYLQVINSDPNFAHEYEADNGGVPFGEGLKSWLDRSPSFSLDKVHSSIRITAVNRVSLLFMWEWFAALNRLGKPVEMVYLQDGVHELQKPWDRMSSQDGNVDWFAFWLKDQEDPDPAKSDQYKRWRQLRTLRSFNDSKNKAGVPPVN